MHVADVLWTRIHLCSKNANGILDKKTLRQWMLGNSQRSNSLRMWLYVAWSFVQKQGNSKKIKTMTRTVRNRKSNHWNSNRQNLFFNWLRDRVNIFSSLGQNVRINFRILIYSSTTYPFFSTCLTSTWWYHSTTLTLVMIYVPNL